MKGKKPELLKKALDLDDYIGYNYNYGSSSNYDDDFSNSYFYDSDFSTKLTYSLIFFGVALSNKDFSQKIHHLECSFELVGRVKLTTSFYSTIDNLFLYNVGFYIGNIFGNYTYNARETSIGVPHWLFGFYFPISKKFHYELSFGRTNVNYSFNYYSFKQSYEKSNFIQVLTRVKLYKNIWIHSLTKLPFSSFAEAWNLGFGISLCDFE